jgi:hypothetical protein
MSDRDSQFFLSTQSTLRGSPESPIWGSHTYQIGLKNEANQSKTPKVATDPLNQHFNSLLDQEMLRINAISRNSPKLKCTPLRPETPSNYHRNCCNHNEETWTPSINKDCKIERESVPPKTPSRYHTKCCGIEEPIPPADKEFQSKIKEMKRMIAKLKIQQSPIEVSYTHSRNLEALKLKKSGIPIRSKTQNPKLRYDGLNSSRNKKEKKSFIIDLVPHIQCLSPDYNDTSRPFREKFQAEYDTVYYDLAEILKKIV